MTTLEKAEHIVKTGNCRGILCNSYEGICPLNVNGIGINVCAHCTPPSHLSEDAIKVAQEYIDANKPKENKMKTTKEFYQHMATEYERGQHLCDTGSFPYEFKTCACCPVTHLCGKDSRARYEFCKAQLAKETEFKYNQTVYDNTGIKYHFITYTPDGKMLVTFNDLPIKTCMYVANLMKGTFYAEDPTKKEKTMTITDIEKALGYKIKVVGEK